MTNKNMARVVMLIKVKEILPEKIFKFIKKVIRK